MWQTSLIKQSLPQGVKDTHWGIDVPKAATRQGRLKTMLIAQVLAGH